MRPSLRRAALIVAIAGACLSVSSGASAQCGAPWVMVPGSGPGPQVWHAMTYESATGRVILLGYAGTQNASTWQYTGATGQWSLLPTAPIAYRSQEQMVYDASAQRIVMFGGIVAGTTEPTATWLFNPLTNTWAEASPANHPPARTGHAMVYDAARQKVLLFGGEIRNVPAADTWEYDGAANTWTQLFPPHSPGPRSYHVMAFDPVRDRVVLIGGTNAFYTTQADEWEWDGTDWERINGANIPPWAVFAAFDTTRERIVAFRPDDVWDYDAAARAWTQRPAPGLGGRNGMAMTLDPSRSVVVLQGGTSGGSALSDTWEWSSAPSAGPSVTQQPSPGQIGATQLGQPVSLSVDASGTGTLAYQWLRDAAPLSDGDGISGAHAPVLNFAPLQSQHLGVYSVTITDDCGPVTTLGASVLPEFRCYANCDQSTAPPYLNVNDFICFQARFAAGDSYANCDGVCNPICLNVNDMICFLSRFAAGCQ